MRNFRRFSHLINTDEVLRTHRHVFGLGERTVVAVTDLVQEEMTTASIAKLFSVDERWIRREAETVIAGIRNATKKHEKRTVRKADRAWRASRQRER